MSYLDKVKNLLKGANLLDDDRNWLSFIEEILIKGHVLDPKQAEEIDSLVAKYGLD